MKVLSRDKIVYQFSPQNIPAETVRPGEPVVFETHDCFTGQIQKESDLVASVDFSRVNPATGPLAVEGAGPGDLIGVAIKSIQVEQKGVMVAIPGEGAFSDRITHSSTKIVPISGGRFHFGPGLSFPLAPMVGVIGVSPEDRPVPCGEIGDHGGNLDAKVIRRDAAVYFLVRAKGALLGMGDVHAGMGDGESVICGVEVPARVEASVSLVKNPDYRPARPVVELKDLVVTIAHGPTLDQAAKAALDDMLDLVMHHTGMSADEASMLISAVGDLKVCQIVDPQKTARVEMPRSVLAPPGKPLFG
ncbi:MAG: acetamidase/formamidase family protein [Spirochaetota bacterium]